MLTYCNTSLMKYLCVFSLIIAVFSVNAANPPPLGITCEIGANSIKLVIRNETADFVRVKIVSSDNNVMVTGGRGNSTSSLTLGKSQFPVTIESNQSDQLVIQNNCDIEMKNAS